MELILIVWLLGLVPAFAFWCWMKGRADERFRMDQRITTNPPYEIGIFTFWAWPVQLVATVTFLLYHLCTSAGAQNGIAFNKDYAEAKKVKRQVDREMQRNMEILLQLGKDPGDIDAQTKRMLTARAIQAAMEDDSARKERELASRQLTASDHRDIVSEILTRDGDLVAPELQLTKNPYSLES